MQIAFKFFEGSFFFGALFTIAFPATLPSHKARRKRRWELVFIASSFSGTSGRLRHVGITITGLKWG